MTAALEALSRAVNLMALRRMLGMAKLRGATEYIVDMLDSLPEDRKVLVFAHHAEVIAALSRHLGEYSPAVITGSTTPREREEAVDKFLMDQRCRVFVGNIQAAGTAITLVGPKCKCSDVIFVESSWTPMDNAQAACRIHRIGQKDGVVARMLSASGGGDRGRSD
jgi:SWI/SNF-related matrix-associated actin-dependent regulator 1 of chromatin subfamily A